MQKDSTLPTQPRKALVGYLSDAFTEIVRGRGLLESEDLCIVEGHSLIAEAFGIALERYDAELCCALPDNLHIHDRRRRTLATKVGDVSFRWRRCRDEAGNTHIPLADVLDLQWGARVSPAARAFLVSAGASVSFAKAASLLASAGGSCVSATTTMSSLRRVGELCAEEDAQAARSLYEDGVIPKADGLAEEICVESDGTWIKLQGTKEDEPKKVEIKAMVSYAGKEVSGTKTSRIRPVRHGCVGSPAEFWTQGIATIGERFDLSEIKRVSFGCDGEPLYKAGEKYLPISAKTDTHLDPFHVNRAVISCFPANERKIADSILGCVIEGEVESAANLLDFCADQEIANVRAPKVAAYLRNNLNIIYAEGPSLGTMEAEQQHVYGCRMDSVPCGWSINGADAMARIRSRVCSGRKLPVPTRAQSLSPRRRRARKRRELDYLKTKVGHGGPVKPLGGYEPEHRASVADMSAEVRYAAGVDTHMVGIGW